LESWSSVVDLLAEIVPDMSGAVDYSLVLAPSVDGRQLSVCSAVEVCMCMISGGRRLVALHLVM
jgi:hypothetical protein